MLNSGTRVVGWINLDRAPTPETEPEERLVSTLLEDAGQGGYKSVTVVRADTRQLRRDLDRELNLLLADVMAGQLYRMTGDRRAG